MLMLMSAALSLTVNDLPSWCRISTAPPHQQLHRRLPRLHHLPLVAWRWTRAPSRRCPPMRRVRAHIPPHSAATWRRRALTGADDYGRLRRQHRKLVSGDATQIVTAFNQQMAKGPARPVQAAMRLWFNPGLSSKSSMARVFVLAISMFRLCSPARHGKEGEQKTILQVYVSSISRMSSCWQDLRLHGCGAGEPWSWRRCCSPTSASPSRRPTRC